MYREPNEHPNYTRQKEEILAAELAAQTVADLGERLKAQIFELLEGTGYQLDVDRWGSGDIVLRHYPQTNPNRTSPRPGYVYDHEISLDR